MPSEGRTDPIAVEKFGDDPKMMSLPTPEPGPGEVQVTMAAVSINPLDWMVADGATAQTSAHRFPLVLGFDGAATITTTGAGVRDFSVGDQVFGQFWADPAGHGTWAEYTVVPGRGAFGAIAKVPAGLSIRMGA
jgi:NADPH:quinone reductase-like Zn-dependent oxidoreductase